MSKITGILLAVSILVLSGCWDRREINDVAFVLGTAIDKENHNYRSTHQIALPGQLGGTGSMAGGGGTSGTKSWYTISDTGRTIREIVTKEQRYTSRTLYFAHRRTLLIGEEMAKDGLEPVMDVLSRIPRNRMNAYVIITRGPAHRLLNADAPIERFPSEMARELATIYLKDARTVKHLLHLMMDDGIDVSVPAAEVIRTNPGKDGKVTTNIHFFGLAVFRDNKLVGFLEEELAQGALWAMGEVNQPEVTVGAPEGKGRIVAQFQETTSKLIPHVRGEDVSMTIKVETLGTIMENESDYVLNRASNLEKLEAALVEKIKGMIEKSVKQLQQKYRSDIIGFGKVLYIKRPNDWNRVGKKWGEIYPSVTVHVDVNVRLKHTGASIIPMGRKERHLIQ